MTDPARLLEGLRRQRDAYRDMASVAEAQKRALEGQDVDALLGIVERKRALLSEVERLEKELATEKAGWAEAKAGVDAATVREVEGVVDEVKALLQELVRHEDEGRALMEKQRSSTADELKDLMRKRRARGAYGAGPGGPRFVDDSK